MEIAFSAGSSSTPGLCEASVWDFRLEPPAWDVMATTML